MTPAQKMNSKKLSAMLTLDDCSLTWRVECNPADAAEFARTSPGQNYQPADMTDLIDRVNALIPPMNFGLCNGQPNPNNGRPHHVYSIGNEGSRVIYLTIHKTYLPTSFDYAILTKELERIGKACRTDEHDEWENDKHSYTFRFWYD